MEGLPPALKGVAWTVGGGKGGVVALARARKTQKTQFWVTRAGGRGTQNWQIEGRELEIKAVNRNLY